MAQKLIMPFKRQMMLCGYKNPEYRKYWGYDHYGIDVSSKQGGAGTDDNVYASGEGVVLAAGTDSKLGKGVVILYKDCVSRNGEVKDLAVKYMHMVALKVAKYDTVSAGDIIGLEGKEGTSDYHLHFEIDTDTTPKYATWTPQVAGSDFWKKGIDSTLNPSLWLWVGENQVIVKPTYNPAWLNEEDFNIPKIASDKPEENVTPEKEDNTMAEMIKLPINEEVPLYVEAMVDGELEEVEAYGEQVWAFVKRPDLPYGFTTYDKYMRRTPCYWTDFGGEFVDESEWEDLVPISQVDPKYLIPRGEKKFVPTDRTNYDHLFDIDPEEPETPDEPVTPDEPSEPDTPVTPDEPVGPIIPVVPTVDKKKAAQILRIIGKAFDAIAGVVEK